MTSSESPQLQIVNEFGRGFDEGDITLLTKHLHKDFRRNIYPRSLGIQERNREEWIKNMEVVVGFTTGVTVGASSPVAIHETSYPPSRRPPTIQSWKLLERSYFTSVSRFMQTEHVNA